MKSKINACLTIVLALIIILGNTGFWYMPNISLQYAVSQSLTINPFSNTEAHYIYTNYFQPLLFGLLGGDTLYQYLIYSAFSSLSFLTIFIIWFIKNNIQKFGKDTMHKAILLVLFPVFFIPFYWIGMDGMTLLLMLLVMINYKSKWSLIFAFLLGIQHLEQGLASFLLLFGSLSVQSLFSKNNKKWGDTKRVFFILISIIIGKISLMLWFNIADIEILGNRSTYLKDHLEMFIQQWISGWGYILYSLFGVGWIVILKNTKTTYPLIIASIIAFIFVATVGDQTRVVNIILFPSLFFWIFMNEQIISRITSKDTLIAISIYLLLPIVYVWEGYPFGSLLKYDCNLINTLKSKSSNIDFIMPFQRNRVSQFNCVIFKASSLNTNTGEKAQNYIFAKSGTKPGFVTYGPYIKLPEGNYGFDISYESSESNTTQVGIWDVVIALPKEAKVIDKGILNGTNHKEGHIIRNFTIPKEYTNNKVEIRNYYNGKGDLTIKSLTITRVQ